MKTSILSRIAFLVAASCLVGSLFVPLWRIELNAPQYPEGLSLEIFANKIGGNVDIINGLNHYIGMKTLHTKDFIEFTVLPYIIIAFVLTALLVALIGKYKWGIVWIAAFIIFGIVAMVDFWRWEYNYGHNLDPNAAIIVPGMAYQPPLIGFKQLLNFGAFSMPALGGWLFIASGLVVLSALILEKYRKIKHTAIYILIPILFCVQSCSVNPEPIVANKDNCDHCKMGIMDASYSGEIITEKGRVYKFDDIKCLKAYNKGAEIKAKETFVTDFNEPKNLLQVEQAHFVKSDSIKTPMNGHIIAFSKKDNAETFAKKYNTNVLTWEQLHEE